MTRVAYIAGSVTGKPDRNREAFEAARLAVERITGLDRESIVTPLPLTKYATNEAQAMRLCLEYICLTVEGGSDLRVVCLPGWRDSLGTLAEVALARKLRVPVVELIDGEIREV